ncbi:MAG TPA: zinc ABC transporter substrate-binding protein, partial [Candidatus Micrarchaeota archaeon]|nr:zinc ABC transporter substrate-binding protein [Candidatus Micrarchaeota archaeon]
MKFLGFSVLFAAALVMALSGCTSTRPANDGTGKLRVAVDIYPYEFLAQQIGGDKVSVVRLFPDGVEPHTYEPAPQDIVAIQQSDVFVYNGIPMNSF